MYAGCAPDHLGEVATLIGRERLDVAENGLRPDELTRVRGQLCGSLALALEDSESKMSRIGKSLLVRQEFRTVEQEFAAIRSGHGRAGRRPGPPVAAAPPVRRHRRPLRRRRPAARAAARPRRLTPPRPLPPPFPARIIFPGAEDSTTPVPLVTFGVTSIGAWVPPDESGAVDRSNGQAEIRPSGRDADMVIVAGHLIVDPAGRTHPGRLHGRGPRGPGRAGVLDFALGADLLDPARVNVFSAGPRRPHWPRSGGRARARARAPGPDPAVLDRRVRRRPRRMTVRLVRRIYPAHDHFWSSLTSSGGSAVAGTRYEFAAELWRWAATQQWVFLRLPDDVSAEIADVPRPRAGFGAVKVAATIGGSRWRTSIFPSAPAAPTSSRSRRRSASPRAWRSATWLGLGIEPRRRRLSRPQTSPRSARQLGRPPAQRLQQVLDGRVAPRARGHPGADVPRRRRVQGNKTN